MPKQQRGQSLVQYSHDNKQKTEPKNSPISITLLHIEINGLELIKINIGVTGRIL